MEIRLFDTNFAHATSCSNGDLKIYPKYFSWYRGNEERDFTVFVDNQYVNVDSVKAKYKIWMLLEPPSVTPNIYNLALDPTIHNKFDYILTFSKELCSKGPKFVYYPLGGCWIEPNDRSIYPKTKHISIIASEKNYTDGHRLRHTLIAKYKGKIDLFGRGYNFIKSKLDALKDYRFTIVIENTKLPGYFSEKLIDPLVTGTIPIYYGDPTVEIAGIIPIQPNIDQLICNPEMGDMLYNSLLSQVKSNFEYAQQYVNTEDWLWENFFTKIIHHKDSLKFLNFQLYGTR